MIKKLQANSIYFILRCCGISCTFEEVLKRKYNATVVEKITENDFLQSNISGVELLSITKHNHSIQDNRLQNIREKANTLLKIAGFIIPVLAYLYTLEINQYIFSIIALCLFLSIVLLINLISISSYSEPVITAKEIKEIESDDSLNKQFAYNYSKSAISNSLTIDYLSDVFRAAYRVLIICILFTFSTITYLTFTVNSNTESNLNTEKQHDDMSIETFKKEYQLNLVPDSINIDLHSDTSSYKNDTLFYNLYKLNE